MRMVRTSLHLTVPELTGLRRLAKRQGITASELVRRAIDSLLSKSQKKKERR